MGIKNLLVELRPIAVPCHIRELRGKKVAVDASCWLHRSAIACAQQLVSGTHTTKYLSFCMHMVKLLLHNDLEPILVFDGRSLPQKRGQNDKRRSNRATAKAEALKRINNGQHKEAQVMFQRAVSITHEMVKSFICALKAVNVEYIVAPYEADAQLAYLAITNQVDAVVSEDSDLLLFGVQRVFFKLDRAGSAIEVDLSRLQQMSEAEHTDVTRKFAKMSPDTMLQTCILSGCDYLDALPGVGLKTAVNLMAKHASYQRVVRILQRTSKQKEKIPEDYLDRFERAFLTFRHQRVYDADMQMLVHLNPITQKQQQKKANPADDLGRVIEIDSDDSDDDAVEQDQDNNMEFLGADLESSVAKLLSEGLLNPKTMQREELNMPVFQQNQSSKHNKHNFRGPLDNFVSRPPVSIPLVKANPMIDHSAVRCKNAIDKKLTSTKVVNVQQDMNFLSELYGAPSRRIAEPEPMWNTSKHLRVEDKLAQTGSQKRQRILEKEDCDYEDGVEEIGRFESDVEEEKQPEEEALVDDVIQCFSSDNSEDEAMIAPDAFVPADERFPDDIFDAIPKENVMPDNNDMNCPSDAVTISSDETESRHVKTFGSVIQTKVQKPPPAHWKPQVQAQSSNRRRSIAAKSSGNKRAASKKARRHSDGAKQTSLLSFFKKG